MKKIKMDLAILIKLIIDVFYNIWKTMSLLMVSESILNEPDVQKNINGITVSPKKNFCIIKLWFNSEVTKTTTITVNKNVKELENYEGIFKQHM